VSPIELDSAAVRDLRERLPGAIYESGRSQVVVRVSPDAQARFVEILAAADAIAAVAGASG
jgi:transcription-repair coupling factor (superfamily II helicase)